MNDRISAWRLFIRIARLGSFSAAGRELEIPQPTVSRVIGQLEADLGAALFTRTTRAVSLTEAGADFLARIEPILADIEEAEHAVRGDGELRGLLRIGLSSSVAVREVVPRLPAFLLPHPKLRIELITSDTRQDLVAEGVDMALRFGPLTDSTAMAKRLVVLPRMIFAAPAYLAQAGTPKTPAELSSHKIVLTPSGIGRSWTFMKGGKTISVRVQGHMVTTLTEAGLAAAVAGMGIVAVSSMATRKEVAAGQLVQLLPDWAMDRIELSAVFPAGRAAKPAARAFADFLKWEMGASLG